MVQVRAGSCVFQGCEWQRVNVRVLSRGMTK